MGYLNRYIFKRITLTLGETLSAAIDINGFELVGIITPAALDGATNDITPQFDPGNGTFYTPLNTDGSAITWWANVAVDEWLQKPLNLSPLVGAKLRLSFSETEAADRTILALLVALPESSE